MTRSGTLLTVIVVAALALPPSASLAQQRRQQIPPGGPILPPGRVLRGPGGVPDLVIIAIQTSTLECVGPVIGKVTISVTVQNQGSGPAVIPPTMPTLGRYWVGVSDRNAFPRLMSIAAGPPPQLSPGEAKTFGVPMIVRQATSAAHPLHYLVDATADPANLILESNEQNNTSFHVFDSKKTCL